jgi:hypothetical protein
MDTNYFGWQFYYDSSGKKYINFLSEISQIPF